MTFWTEVMTLPHELKMVDVKGVTTRTFIAGEGEPVIFLHGISGHLEAFIPSAADHAAKFNIHMIDMLGHGYTDKPGGDYTVERLAHHVLDYLDTFGIDRAHLVGISQGGQTAGYLAAEFPDRVGRVTMIVPAGVPGIDPEMVKRFLNDATNAAVFSDDPADTRQRLVNVVHDPAVITDELVDVRYRIYHEPAFREAVAGILAAAEPENYVRDAMSPERLAKIESEVLVVWAAHDPSGGKAGEYFVNHLAHSRLVVFDNAGHWAPFERPRDFGLVNTAFLQGGLDAVPAEVH